MRTATPGIDAVDRQTRVDGPLGGDRLVQQVA
jgi:hypothetical protein